jgi:hypothetical protein
MAITMYRKSVLFVVFLLLAHPLNAGPISIKNVTLPDTIIQDDSGNSLVLNGAGVRTKFIFDIYVGALYLMNKSNEPDEILEDNSAKRVSMHFLYDEISKKKMITSWIEGFENNLNKEQFSRLQNKIQSFYMSFDKTVEGDVVIVDFMPDHSTTVTINDVRKATIQGADFQRALLSVWLGGSPVDSDLKRAMLGKD